MYAEIELESNKVIKELSDKLGLKLREDIKKIMVDCALNNVCSIVEAPEGDNQNESYEVVTNVYVEQWSDGDSGDSFQGNIYCELPTKQWLKLPFWM
jgi:hypothetical protein